MDQLSSENADTLTALLMVLFGLFICIRVHRRAAPGIGLFAGRNQRGMTNDVTRLEKKTIAPKQSPLFKQVSQDPFRLCYLNAFCHIPQRGFCLVTLVPSEQEMVLSSRFFPSLQRISEALVLESDA